MLNVENKRLHAGKHTSRIVKPVNRITKKTRQFSTKDVFSRERSQALSQDICRIVKRITVWWRIGEGIEKRSKDLEKRRCVWNEEGKDKICKRLER